MTTDDFIIYMCVNIVSTIVVYWFVPIAIIIGNVKLKEKTLKKIVIVNGVVGFLIFQVLHFFLGGNAGNVLPAIFWSGLIYKILKRTSCKEYAPKRNRTSTENSAIIMERCSEVAPCAMTTNQLSQSDYESDEDFGLVPEKPIYTLASMMVDGEIEYLNKLYSLSGEKISWKRQGSLCVEGVSGMVDAYDTYTPSGFYKTIYVNMYGDQKSKKAPKGFMLITDFAIWNNSAVDKNKVSQESSIWKCDKCGSNNISRRECWNCGKKREQKAE